MYSVIYLALVMLLFLLIYVLIGPQLMANTLLFLILITLLGIYSNENK